MLVKSNWGLFTFIITGACLLIVVQYWFEESNQISVRSKYCGVKNIAAETEPAFMERMRVRMEKRRQRLKRACIKLGLDNIPFRPQVLMTVTSHKWLNCRVQKAGSTNIGRLVANLLTETDKVELAQINPINDAVRYHAAEALSLVRYNNLTQMAGFIRTITVRQPFVRLVSAYKSKIENYSGNSSTESKSILSPWSSRESMPGNVTFSRFIQHVLYGHKAKSPFEGHWAVYNQACQPCHVDYVVISKLETIEEDSRYMLALIGAPRNLTFAKGYGNNGSMKNVLASARPYAAQLNQTELEKLHETFYPDYKLFGYDMHFKTLN